MKKSIKSFLSVLFLVALLINVIPVYAGATATVAPTAAATDAAATVAPTAAASGDVTYSGSYNAYMGIQTDTNLWIFRNAYDDKDYGFGTPEFSGLSSVANGTTTSYPGTFTDAVIDGDGTYTVTLENPDFQSETHLSLLYVSTDIPLSDKVKITNVQAKFDGSTKYTFDQGYLDPDSKTYVKILCLNNWNADVKDLFFYNMPPKKVEITFTIEGMGYKSTAQAAPTVAPTTAPAADTSAATTDTSAAATDTSAAATDTSDSSSNTGLVIGIIAAVVVVAVVVIVLVTKKKKK
ncbi:MAG TPA: hypothetical protein VN258_16195 [Mobilitalea sp.]|nr:hypothetical protein [Mobilitalea sp.]